MICEYTRSPIEHYSKIARDIITGVAIFGFTLLFIGDYQTSE